MKLLSLKPGHDGHIVSIESSHLKFLLEAEKDSFPRYSEINPTILIESFSMLNEIPDVICLSGWVKGFHSIEPKQGAGYFGIDNSLTQRKELNFFGHKINFFSSTHERSHILCSYGLSNFKQGEPCYFLLWEGTLGNFYEIDEFVNIKLLASVMPEPGNKYSFLFSLADPRYKDVFRFESAGKLMALAAFSDRTALNYEEKKIIDYIIDKAILKTTKKSDLYWSRFFNIGVENNEFKNLAGKFSDALFDKFYQFALHNCKKGYPLLIGGGCGLNCEWNTKWKDSGIFPEVFVPPISNDAGAALGTAIDAQFYFTGNAKISWDVYSGAEFNFDADNLADWKAEKLDLFRVAKFIQDDNIIAWVQGKCEIGPRALGNRSLLGPPFKKETQSLLNNIKNRESYRPIAPICLQEDVSSLFEWSGESPYMLYFQKIKNNRLQAISHVDNTARVQTVTSQSNNKMYQLLLKFKELTGFGVLCNTSLNHNGRGFINSMSDLADYCYKMNIEGFVVNELFYTKINKYNAI